MSKSDFTVVVVIQEEVLRDLCQNLTYSSSGYIEKTFEGDLSKFDFTIVVVNKKKF